MKYQEFTIKQNDRKPALVATVKEEDGQSFNLEDSTGVNFKMRLRGASQNKVDSSLDKSGNFAEIIDIKGGRVQYLWQPGDTDTPGKYEAEFEILYVDGVQHVPTDEPFIVHVVKDRIA